MRISTSDLSTFRNKSYNSQGHAIATQAAVVGSSCIVFSLVSFPRALLSRRIQVIEHAVQPTLSLDWAQNPEVKGLGVGCAGLQRWSTGTWGGRG